MRIWNVLQEKNLAKTLAGEYIKLELEYEKIFLFFKIDVKVSLMD